VPGPNADLWRSAPAANSFFLRGLLQWGPYALGLGQRRAPVSDGAALRCHRRNPDLVWAAPPLRPDIIFGKDSLTDTCISSAKLFEAEQALCIPPREPCRAFSALLEGDVRNGDPLLA
jgi:hypothetical protein